MKITASQFLQELVNLDMQKLSQIKGLGPIIIENLGNFVKSESRAKMQKKFEELEKNDKGVELGFGKIKNQKIQNKILKKNTKNSLENDLKELEKNQENSQIAENYGQIGEENSEQNFVQSQEKIEKNLEENIEVICITGTFEIQRSEIIDKLEAKGFEVANSLTKNVTILLCGDKSGSKLTKAIKMGIKIVKNLDELIDI